MNHGLRTHEIAHLLDSLRKPITLAYSGGKDSSAVLKIIWAAARLLGSDCLPIEVIYCDTEVENIIVDRYVKSTLDNLALEAEAADVPITCKIIYPKVDQSFFVRMIGRGYVPPTRSFRWCTSDIRIRPFRNYLKSGDERKFIAVGTRFGESSQRDRSLSKFYDQDRKFLQRQVENFAQATLITPIIDYSTADVWEALCELDEPVSVSPTALASIYKEGSGECPTIRDFKDKPCTKARFGCWTCTVVRRDRSAENMIAAGHAELEPYHRFRSWLTEIRNDEGLRCHRRRNGTERPGPFTLAARELILERLTNLELATGRKVLTNEHRAKIAELIALDRNSPAYQNLES